MSQRVRADLVKAKSVNSPGNTKAASQVLIKKYKEFGIKANIAALYSDKPNIIAEINPGHRPQLVFNSHIDTVPVGDLKQWSYDPFLSFIEQGKM
ncbi:MAG: hypothetical protein JSV20_04860, partial [Candidatus Bathyarchaeota archaeon]